MCARAGHAAGDKYRFEAKSIVAKGSEEIREGEKEKRAKGSLENEGTCQLDLWRSWSSNLCPQLIRLQD